MNIFVPKKYLQLTAAVLLLFSILLICLPKYLMRLLGIAPSETGAVFIQFLGAALAGHAYVNYYAKNLEGYVLRLALMMNIVSLVLSVAVSMFTILHRTATTIGILILVMHLAFLTGFLISMRRIN